MSASLRVSIGVLVLAALGAGWAAAQDESPRRGFSSLLNIDALIDNHARMLARRYNLTPEQDQFTQEFLRAKCDEFLAQHRDELFALVDRMFEVRGGGEMDAAELVQWGKKALPLFEQAKHLIIEGNAQWREILTDEQRKIHDEDLRQMYESFSGTEEQLHRIVTGQMTVEEFRRGDRLDGPARRGPGPRTITPSPVTPAPPPAQPSGAVNPAPPPKEGVTPGKPGGGPPNPRIRTPNRPEPVPPPSGGVANPNPPPTPPPRGGFAGPNPPPTGGVVNPPGGRIPRGGVANPAAMNAGFEGQWEAYVREFIQRYQLDEAQSQKAYAILRECQDQARGYMSRRKADFDRLDERLKSINNEPDKTKALQEIQQQRLKLLEPVGRIFEKQLKPRLERLPTRAQRQAAEAAGKAPPGKADHLTPGKGPATPGGVRSPKSGLKPSGPPPMPNPPVSNPPVPQPEPIPEIPPHPEPPPEMPSETPEE